METVIVTPPINSATFRTDFPEFADANDYPDSSINYWLAIATIMIVAPRWGRMLVFAIESYTAHNLVLEKQAQDAASLHAWPGISKGVISAETPGAVSVNYDSSMTLEEEGGFWNLTTFGTRFLHLARLAGMGPMQVGPACGCPGTVPGAQNDLGQAYSGPSMIPSPGSTFS
jgi:hypothetical protein